MKSKTFLFLFFQRLHRKYLIVLVSRTYEEYAGSIVQYKHSENSQTTFKSLSENTAGTGKGLSLEIPGKSLTNVIGEYEKILNIKTKRNNNMSKEPCHILVNYMPRE